MMICAIFSLLVMTGVCLAFEPKDLCQNKKPVEWVPDPLDCTTFYMCFNGQTFKYVCPKSQVWNHQQRVCVEPGSALDTCSIVNTTPAPTLAPRMTKSDCIPGMARAAHKDNCAQYFDCISKRSGGKNAQEPLLMECPYPLMFDDASSICQFPKKVKCGDKWTPTDPCEYSQNQCRSAQCVPCNLRFPSCKGLPDGLHPWTGKEWTPNYIVCEHERVMYTGMCEVDRIGKRKLFNPDQRSCMERIIIQFQP